jgi:hypothetical protein
VAFQKIGLTNQFFNLIAQEQAALNHVQLVDQAGIELLLKRHPVTLIEIERLLYTSWEN